MISDKELRGWKMCEREGPFRTESIYIIFLPYSVRNQQQKDIH